jgi:hypothetical protein
MRALPRGRGGIVMIEAAHVLHNGVDGETMHDVINKTVFNASFSEFPK